MEFAFKGEVVLTLNHEEGDLTSKHVSTDFNLAVKGGLNHEVYLNEEGLPTQEGVMVLSNVLIQGLVGNIHFAHDQGFKDSAEHLRWVISELERGFVTVAHVSKSTFKD